MFKTSNNYVKIWGGPGCGKTTNEMQAYQSFLNSGYIPSQITAITFRKSSADSLVQKVALSTQADPVVLKSHVGTIHSICNRLTGPNTVIEPSDINKFAKTSGYLPYISKKRKFSESVSEEDSAYSGNLFDLYTWVRNTQTKIEDIDNYPGFDDILLPIEKIPEFFADYEKYKQTIGKIDFGDMLQRVLDNKVPLDTPVLIVDEFQDLTSQMYQIFEQWFPQCEHVVIAGDPLQSIYGFWGGSPDYYKNWKAQEVVLHQSYRLPAQIWNFAKDILRYEGMEAPEVTAKSGYKSPIKEIDWDDTMPVYGSELHLIRCNYQAPAVAMQLAESGRLFGGLYGWTAPELNIARAVINYRSENELDLNDWLTLINYYPVRFFGIKYDKETLIKEITRYATAPAQPKWFGTSFTTPSLINSLSGEDPAAEMIPDNKLFTAKINGVKDLKMKIAYIPPNKEGNYPTPNLSKKIMTFHGAKGLEADAVFMHTAITGRIQKSIVIPGEESAAEARVWYVAATRAKDTLYIVKDAHRNYELPEVVAC